MAEESVVLVPQVEQVVEFYGDPIVVAMVGEQAYVPLRSLTEFLGLTWPPQYQRIQRDEVLSRHSTLVEVTAADGKSYSTLCLELQYLPGWLFGIQVGRIKEELQEKLIRYREECFNVLWRAFQTTMPEPQSSSHFQSPLEQVRGLALAIATLAEQQMAMEGRVELVDIKAATALARIDRAAEVVKALNRRLSAVETRISPGSFINDDQAQEVAGQVKALAELLTSQEGGKNHYQGVFAELYRRFGVSSYKLIRQEQYDAVLAFLEDWRCSITNQ
jgi:hypothetical protein